MVENNYHVLEEDKKVYSDIWDKEKRALINYEVVDLLNEQDEQIQSLKEDVEIILDYVLHKGKFAMTVKEQKAHNRLRSFVRGDTE